MNLDPVLLDVLACPCEKHAPVEVDEANNAIVCTHCATSFPVRDDIPVMLLSDATPGPNGIGGGVATTS